MEREFWFPHLTINCGGTVTDIEEELEGENYSELGDNWMKYHVELDDSEKLGQEEFWYSMNEIILIEI